MAFDLNRLGFLAALLAVGCSAPPAAKPAAARLDRSSIGSRLASAEVENLDYESDERASSANRSVRMYPQLDVLDGDPLGSLSGIRPLAVLKDEAKDGPVASSNTEKKSPARPQIVGQVVRGTPAPGRSIGIVDIERCFDLIPSYRKVHAERTAKEYARYLLLISQANDEFRQAVDWIALRDGVDVVVEKGGVVGGRTIDITDEVCERLREQRGDYTR